MAAGVERTPEPSRHAGKFRVATGFLAGVGLAALVVAVILLAQGSQPTAVSQAWSEWSPTAAGADGAAQIAAHVAPNYRIDPANQLDVVTVVHTASAAAVSAATSGTTAAPASGYEVAIKTTGGGSQVSVLTGTTVAYNLCGLGTTNCAIGTGTPSAARLLLLRRESLELALYTFHYLPNVENVVALLPPGHTQQATSTLTPTPPKAGAKPVTKPINIAVLFVRSELAPLLAHPLDAILPEYTAPTVAQMSTAIEARLVSQVTAQGLFAQHTETAPDGSSLLMLDQIAPQ